MSVWLKEIICSLDCLYYTLNLLLAWFLNKLHESVILILSVLLTIEPSITLHIFWYKCWILMFVVWNYKLNHIRVVCQGFNRYLLTLAIAKIKTTELQDIEFCCRSSPIQNFHSRKQLRLLYMCTAMHGLNLSLILKGLMLYEKQTILNNKFGIA